jgi:hypothetical protein
MSNFLQLTGAEQVILLGTSQLRIT